MSESDEFEVTIDGYFAILPEWIIDAEISDRAVRLYAVLRRYANGEMKARPSRSKLAARLRCSLSSVKRALKELQEIGAITVRPRWTTSDFTSFTYSKDAEHHVQAANGYVLHSHPRKTAGGSTSEPTPKVTCEPGVGPQVNTGVGPRVTRGAGSRVDHELKPEEPKPEEQILSSSAKPPRKAEPHLADVDALCAALADGMVANGCKRPNITDAWKREARLLLDADGRDFDKAMRLIDWCQSDPFWRANIHSMSKFRKQYEQLRMRAVEQYTAHRGQSPNAPGGIARGDQKVLDTLRRGEDLKRRLAANQVVIPGQREILP